MDELYTLPRGVSLGRGEVHEALAATGIAAYSSVTIARGSALTHTFLDRTRGLSLRVVESEMNRLTEVVGDAALWLRVRAVACDVAECNQRSAGAEGEVTELGGAGQRLENGQFDRELPELAQGRSQ